MPPISGWDPVFPVMKAIQGIDPKSALDVGIGTGQWGWMIRNYHDMRWGRFKKADWKVDLVGIEACGDYDNPTWDLYSKIFIGDAFDVVNNIKVVPQFDVVVMIEVLEHFEKERGKTMLRRLKEIGKHVIFSYANMEQGAAYGNPYEIHRSTWSDAEILEMFPNAVEIYRTDVGTYFKI